MCVYTEDLSYEAQRFRNLGYLIVATVYFPQGFVPILHVMQNDRSETFHVI